jgi:hypothetical protein
MSVKNFDLNVLCKIDQFRYFSKINGLSLLDGTYLERLISYFLKDQNLISSKIMVDLRDLKVVLEVDTTEGIKGIFIRLSNVGALSFAKVGKYHKQKYNIIIDPEYFGFFSVGLS